jgi:inner membrane protein
LTPRATLLLMLAANAPDIDVVSRVGGSAAYLYWHRHFTHSLVAVPALAAVVAGVLHLATRRRVPFARAWLAALAGVASHPLLDLTNMYGIRLGLPFTDHWFRLDITSVIDLWIWAVLLGAAFGPMIGRLVSEEMGARRGSGRGWAWAALLFLLIYSAGRFVLHAHAAATLETRLYQGVPAARVAALPDAVNPLRWRGLAETEAFYAAGEVDLASEFDPRSFSIIHKPAETPLMARAREAPGVREFLVFAQYPLWSEEPAPGGVRVSVRDLRFGFVAAAEFDAAGRMVGSGFSFGGK